MKSNKTLFDLIESLSPNEKRFFKIYATRHTIGEKNNYVKLFELFDNIRPYNEELIAKKASEAPFVKFFAAEKNYLYNLLLDCLDSYHKESSVDRQISKQVNIGRILLEKKLDEQGAAILEKAKRISAYHNRHENILPINYLLKKTAFAKELVNASILNELDEEENVALGAINENQKYRQILNHLILRRRLYGVTSDQLEIAKITQQYPHLIEAIPKEFHSFGIEVNYLTSRLEFCRITRNKTEGYTIVQRLLGLMENNRAKITDEYIERYIHILYTFIVTRLYKTVDEANQALSKLKDLDQYIDAKVTKSEHARCFEYHFTALTDLFLENKEYKKINDVIADFHRAFAIYAYHMTPSFVLALHFNIACLYFGMGEYREALKWTNKVRNVVTSFREDIFYQMRTLDLILHLELGNDDILPSLIQSANYYHKKAKHNMELQKNISRRIKELLKANNNKEKQQVFIQLKDNLMVLRNNPLENSIFSDLDLIAWITKKINELK